VKEEVKEEASNEEPGIKEEQFSGSETESEYEEDEQNVAVDLDGHKMVDSRGHGMIKVCEEEDAEDENARKEMEELRQVDLPYNREAQRRRSRETAPVVKQENDSSSGNEECLINTPMNDKSVPKTAHHVSSTEETPPRTTSQPKSANVGVGAVTDLPPAQSLSELWESAVATAGCPTCSLVNEKGALTCVACANVLDPGKMSDHWRCQTLSCRRSAYMNAGDCGVCGVCGAAKPI